MSIYLSDRNNILTNKNYLENNDRQLNELGIFNLRNKGLYGKNVIIAIIDSGIDTKHTDFENKILVKKNFTKDGGSNDVTDYIGHGTHVSGIIGSNNKKYSISVAPESKMIILKVVDKDGRGTDQSLIEALKYVYHLNMEKKYFIDVINLSVGTVRYSEKMYEYIKAIYRQGTVIVCSSGNYGDNIADTEERIYPGFFKQVIQIGSVDKDNNISKFSNSNSNIDFVAPGENIYSTIPNNKYIFMSGTSMATPFVSGGIALLIEGKRKKLIQYDNLLSYLSQKSKKLDTSIQNQGNGLIRFS